MNKKIVLLSIFSVLMFTTMSMVSAINSTTIDNKEKESPLYKVRAEQAYNPQGRIRETRNTLLSRFLGENRLFFVQEPSAGDLSVRNLFLKGYFTNIRSSLFCCHLTFGKCTTGTLWTCGAHGCGPT